MEKRLENVIKRLAQLEQDPKVVEYKQLLKEKQSLTKNVHQQTVKDKRELFFAELKELLKPILKLAKDQSKETIPLTYVAGYEAWDTIGVGEKALEPFEELINKYSSKKEIYSGNIVFDINNFKDKIILGEQGDYSETEISVDLVYIKVDNNFNITGLELADKSYGYLDLLF